MEHLSGVLNINKEEGPTSHDVVAKLRKLLGLRQIGHTGTLDPGATGVLVLCIGQATRIAQYFEALDKAYEAELILGITTTTEDKYGEVLSEKPVEIEEAQLAAALKKFRGPILQIPPMYSQCATREFASMNWQGRGRWWSGSQERLPSTSLIF